MDVTRIPPQSIDAEHAALSCMLRCEEAALTGIAQARAEYFHVPANREIFEAMHRLRAEDKPIDIVSVKERIGDLARIGGAQKLMEILSAAPSPSIIGHVLDTLRSKWMARRTIAICSAAVASAYECGEDGANAAQEAYSALATLLGEGLEGDPDEIPLKESVHEFLNYLEDLHQRGQSVTGVPFGLLKFDEHTGGAQPGEMWVICGLTKSGKTALAMQALITNLLAGLPCSLFSLEMTRRQIIGRAISFIGRVSGNFFRRPRLMTERDFKALSDGASKTGALPLRVHETKRTLSKMSAALERDVRKFGVKLAVIDYTQLVDGERTGDENREREVARVSSSVKRMAVKHGIPIFLLSQTNDDGKLRESRAIGQDADAVIKVLVPMKEKGNQPDLASPDRTIAIEYARSFASETFPVTFINSQTRFEDGN